MWRKTEATSGRRWRCPAFGVILSLVILGFPESTQAQENANSERLDVIAAMPRDFPPQYSVDENARPIGFAVDVMDEIAALAGLRVTYLVEDSWADANAALLDGRAELIPNLGITPQRQLLLDFTAPVETFPVSIPLWLNDRGAK